MVPNSKFAFAFQAIASVIAVVALSACASQRPPDDYAYDGAVPDQWGTASTTTTVDGFWWYRFEDTRLNALIAEALLENPGLQQADARTAQALAQARIAGADRLPQLSAAFNSSRQKQSLAGFPVAGGQDGTASIFTESHGASLNVSWEIDLWGRIGALSEAAREDFLASEQNFRAVEQSIAAQTAKLYFSVIEASEQVALSESTVAVLEETARQVSNRADAGVVAPTDKLFAISNLETARAGLQQRRDAHQRAIRVLQTLLRDYPGGSLETPGQLPAVPQTPPADLPADLLTRRPDLLAAERNLRAAGLRETASRRALLPTFSLTGSAGQQSAELADLLDGDFSVWSIAGQLVQPIFQGGRLNANIALAEARQREAVEGYAEAALNAFFEVESALASDSLLAAREESLLIASDAAAEAQRIAVNRYKQGVTLFITVLESQQRTLDTRSALISARRARLDNRIDLHLALGGGFDQGAE